MAGVGAGRSDDPRARGSSFRDRPAMRLLDVHALWNYKNDFQRIHRGDRAARPLHDARHSSRACVDGDLRDRRGRQDCGMARIFRYRGHRQTTRHASRGGHCRLRSVAANPMHDEEVRLRPQIERLVGGRIISLERQPRWRKAWYAVVERDGAAVPIFVRGDKQIDAEPYPGLEREAAILHLFRANDLPVPRVYGMTENPTAIVMDRVSGIRDVGHAGEDDERRRVAEQYIEVLARMHELDTTPFVAAGMSLPKGPTETA